MHGAALVSKAGQAQGQHGGEDRAWHWVGLGSQQTMLWPFGPCCVSSA